jgi:hypothetical protein
LVAHIKRETQAEGFREYGAEEEVRKEWRRLHNEEIYALYCSPNTIRVIKSRRLRWARQVACMGESRCAYRISVGKPEGRRPLGRRRRRWEDNIKMDLRELEWEGTVLVHCFSDRVPRNLRVPQNVVKGSERNSGINT